MTFSIIIATYNAGNFLDTAIKSVILNEFPSKELIIIDGGSKDNTIEIIKSYEKYLSYWVSEPDNGIYDAWNKGILKSSGDWIMFLGCDDALMPGTLEKYSKYIGSLKKDIDYVSSRMQMIDIKGKQVRIKGWAWEWPEFLSEMMVAHPGSLHSKNLFKNFGIYDTKYKIAGDYELLLRPRENLKACFMDEITVIMQEGGVSDSLMALHEHKRAAMETGGESALAANLNFYKLQFKLKAKTAMRKIGINAYLKK